ncbi:hydroxyacylglutathione hydrolase [Blastochloris viridis]|uniref:Hydroxyacylglutathione hydrolase n=1 Tax=Blastochloris viridis TaxID=1079 RepID=A0A0H5BEJ4_BLAVI|nr:hydroxyacylglutathione hydrolase [Blastochloris viridis]ALK07968.1 Hydroxyacylglutathione hydrolase [Blastochloris viridis]BAR98776.1 hydroxyacylglutathione hydrolase [Blastochloris viridis]CUU43890.1 Hydroxyacylglutathione hydrolase [Blastochloris viridis]
MTATIRQFRCRSDNYGVLIFDSATRATAAIDAPDAAAIQAELAANGWRLTDILVTHHHADHTAGIAELVAATGCRVLAAKSGDISHATATLADGDHVRVGALAATVLATPGHTLDHLAFWFADVGAVFVGDTLFSLGCGRLFEGSAAEMWASLDRLRALPDDTLVYCGHEYTAANARFALTIEPNNAALAARVAEVERLNAEGRPTLPTTIGLENATNPFLRADRPEVAAAVGLSGASAAAVFAELRRRKDRF